MCGRFVMDRKTSDLMPLFEIDIAGETLPEPSWNIAPTQPIAIVIDTIPRGEEENEPVRRLEAARWGLVPSWSKEIAGPPLFNARSESVTEKASFREAVKKRRAVVPASGYYEWRTVDGVKSPQYISLPDNELLLFAALYDWWKSPDGWLLSASILTRASAGTLAPIHDRMPVMLDAELLQEWLDPHQEGTPELVGHVTKSGATVADRTGFHPVSPEVGPVRNNAPHLVLPVG